MASKRAYICGVPPEFCTGSVGVKQKAVPEKTKLHGGRDQSFKCKVQFLKRDGWTQIGSREFRKEGLPILVLTKPSRFGGELKYCSEKTRFMHRGGPHFIGSF